MRQAVLATVRLTFRCQHGALMLRLLDIAFWVLHTLLILFNMTGWAFRRTRVAHLVSLGLTLFSWFVMGAWYGWGYCLCTDWHWQVRRQLGYVVAETSYIQLMVRQFFGLSLTRSQSDWLVGSVLVAILIATAVTWWRARRRPGGGDHPSPRS